MINDYKIEFNQIDSKIDEIEKEIAIWTEETQIKDELKETDMFIKALQKANLLQDLEFEIHQFCRTPDYFLHVPLNLGYGSGYSDIYISHKSSSTISGSCAIIIELKTDKTVSSKNKQALFELIGIIKNKNQIIYQFTFSLIGIYLKFSNSNNIIIVY